MLKYSNLFVREFFLLHFGVFKFSLYSFEYNFSLKTLCTDVRNNNTYLHSSYLRIKMNSACVNILKFDKYVTNLLSMGRNWYKVYELPPTIVSSYLDTARGIDVITLDNIII